MRSRSRTQNTVYNFLSGVGGQLLSVVMQFLIRTVFIFTLGQEYLGINGLFSNILSMLSLAEMGVGGAIVYKLYEPLRKQDTRRIASLMRFYKRAYRLIGVIICITGICLIPFLRYFINDYDQLSHLSLNIPLVFLLYLLNSVASYFFFAYKSALMMASQRQYIIELVGYLGTLFMSAVQIVCLLTFKRFEIYVVVLISQTVFQNILIGRFADKEFPLLKDKNVTSLSTYEIKNVFKDCLAIFIYKVNSVVLTATDNIVISTFLGLKSVAVYSNYLIFYTTIRMLFSKVYNAVGHSIGDLHAARDLDKEYVVFRSLMLVTAILGGTGFVGLAVVANEFVVTWLGSDWVLDELFAFLLGLEIFTAAYKFALSKYRNAMGLFQQAKYRPIAGMLINLVVSIGLVRKMGISGVLIGTVLSDWLTFAWYDPLAIHKFGFEKRFPVSRYYFTFIKNFVVVCFMLVLNSWVCNCFFVGYGWLSVVVHSVICAVTVPSAIVLTALRTEEYAYLRMKAMKLCTRLLRYRERK